MNGKQMERKLRELFRRKPNMSQPGRLIGHLLNELGVATDNNNKFAETIERVLEKLERNGELELDRSGAIFNGYRFIKKPKPAPKPQQKSTPVVSVPTPAPAPAQEEQEQDMSTAGSGFTRAELVTMALNVLQDKADEKGHVYVPSAIGLIMETLEVSESEAKELNEPLHRLGLRTSPRGRNDEGKRPHWVSLEVTEVTDEMLEVARSKPEPEQIGSDVEQRLLGVIAELESQLAERQADVETAERLAEIIEGLESGIAAQDALMQDATSALDVKTRELEKMAEERDTLKQEVRELRAQLLKRSTPSAAVASVLQRYGK